MNHILIFQKFGYAKFLNNTTGLIQNIKNVFSTNQQSYQTINVTKMQLSQFVQGKQIKPQNITKEYNDLEKYMIVKRKSMLTGGRIQELKGIEVQRILQQSSSNLMRDLDKYNPIDIINLILLDHSTFKLSQNDLVNYISQKLQQNNISNKEYIFLVKSTLFCLSDKRCESELMKHIDNILQKSNEYIQLSPYTACQLLIIYYSLIKKQFKLFDKENNFFLKTHEQQLKLEQQFRKQHQMQNQVDSDKLFYEVIIENTLKANYNNEQLLDLISELVYIGKFQRSDLLKQIYDSFDLEHLNLQQLIQLFINTTSKNVHVDEKIYNTFLQKIRNHYKINENQIQNEQQQNLNKKTSYSYIKLNLELIKFIQGSEEKQCPSLIFQEEIEEQNTQISSQAKVDILWILIRNFSEENDELYQNLFKSLSQDIQCLQIRHLLSLIQSFIGYQMNKNIEFVFSENSNLKLNYCENLIDLNLAIKMLISRISLTKQPISDKQQCSLYLNLIYLINSQQINSKQVQSSFLNELKSQYKKYAIVNEKASKTEDKFMSIFEKLQKQNLIQEKIQRGALIDSTYFVDFLVGQNTIIEVNGDVHHNQQTKSQIRQNYLQKLFYFKLQNYKVIIFDSNQYLPIINDSQKFEEFITQAFKSNNLIQNH